MTWPVAAASASSPEGRRRPVEHLRTGRRQRHPGRGPPGARGDAAAELSVSLTNLPDRGVAVAGAVAEAGQSALDKSLGTLDVRSVSRVHGPSLTGVVAGVATADDLGLDTTLRVRYDAEEAPDAVAKRLTRLNQVAWAEPNRWREASIVPHDPQFGSQWGLTRIGCPDAWDHTTGNPAIVVAVIDTGVDMNHPELAPLLRPGRDLVDFPPGAVPKPGWVFEGDFTGADAIPQDEVGHGTHVAGTSAARATTPRAWPASLGMSGSCRSRSSPGSASLRRAG